MNETTGGKGGVAYEGTVYVFQRGVDVSGFDARECGFEEGYFGAEIAGDFACVLDGLSSGRYGLEVWLFAEVCDRPGVRRIEISIDGEVVEEGLSFLLESPAARPVRKRYSFTSTGAPVRVRFRPKRGAMSFSRIVVRDEQGGIVLADSVADRIRARGGTLGDKRQTLHAIGNAHLDPVWQWRWQEGCAEVVATIRSALDRMKEYEEFKFSCSSAQYFAWLEEVDAGLLEEVRARVAEGRFEVVGGWWVQPDCNISSGEALVRHSLYGQRFFERVLGRRAVTGYNVDSFGHASTIPQILAKSGMTNYVFMRPQPGEKGLPAEQFWWEGPDGSRVLACRLVVYNSEDVTPDRFAIFPVIDANYPCAAHRPYFFGVGNHGGGPTRRQIEGVMELDRDGDVPRIAFSTTEALFAGMRESGVDFPVVRDELQHHAPGCYTTHSGLKRANRRCESLLTTAERFDTIASVLSRPAGAGATRRIEQAWRGVLFNQFHDTMGGTGLAKACEDAMDLYGKAADEAECVLNTALRRIAARVDTRGEGAPFIVFNPSGRRRREVIEAGFITGGTPAPADETGARIASQMRRVDGVAYVTFEADVPAMGYRVYRLVDAGALREGALVIDEANLTMSNEHVSVRVDRETGAIAELRLAGCEVNFAEGGANALVSLEDAADAWGHGTVQWTNVLDVLAPTEITFLARGPVRGTIRVECAGDGSAARFDISLSAGAKHVEIEALVNCGTPRRMLKLCFNGPFEGARHTAAVAYGCIERTGSEAEEPCQSWVDLFDERAGIAVLNDCKYGYDVTGGAVRLTLARTVPYVGSTDRFHDMGEQSVRLALVPHVGDWRGAGVAELARALDEPLIVLRDHAHDGDLPQAHSFAACESPNVDLAVLKCAEDGDDVVARLVETAGRAADAHVELPVLGRSFSRRLAPHEIATVRMPRNRRASPVDTDLLEEKGDGSLFCVSSTP